MPNLERLLRRFSPKERKELEPVVERIVKRDLAGLDCKKLKGLINLFRVRRRKIRIIFEISGKEALILSIERRRAATYKF